MLLKLITSEGLKLEKEIKSLSLPAQGGQMQVLPEHAPTVMLISGGKVVYDHSVLAVGRGVARVYQDEILLLVEGVRGRVSH